MKSPFYNQIKRIVIGVTLGFTVCWFLHSFIFGHPKLRSTIIYSGSAQILVPAGQITHVTVIPQKKD